MNRPSRQSIFMEVATIFSKRSTCFRLNVGAIIVANNRQIISTGYNGAASGDPHCTGNRCPGRNLCKQTIHAEVNALKLIPTEYLGQSLDIYCTDSPCYECAEMIFNKGIKRVFYDRKYRDETPIDFLLEAGIEVYRVTSAGYVIRHRDQELVDL